MIVRSEGDCGTDDRTVGDGCSKNVIRSLGKENETSRRREETEFCRKLSRSKDASERRLKLMHSPSRLMSPCSLAAIGSDVRKCSREQYRPI